MEDVMLKREEATEFFQRDRRSLHHECYVECCTWEEVREYYPHNADAVVCFIELFHFIISTLPLLPLPCPHLLRISIFGSSFLGISADF